MGPICSEWFKQSDRRKILEPPWSVLDTEPHGPKTLDIAPMCGIKAIFTYDTCVYHLRRSNDLFAEIKDGSLW